MAATVGTAENPTLTEAILAVLAESDLPIQTPDLIAIVATGKTSPRQRVWTQLMRLYHRGLIECQSGRTIPDGPNKRGYAVKRWRLSPCGRQRMRLELPA